MSAADNDTFSQINFSGNLMSNESKEQLEPQVDTPVMVKRKLFSLSGPELKGTGLVDVTVQPWVKDPRINVTSWLNATVATEEACISIDAVRRVFGPITSKMHSGRIVTTHPVQRPKPLHGTGNLGFSPLQNPLNQEAGIVFGFEYQTCATDFSFSYLEKFKDAAK